MPNYKLLKRHCRQRVKFVKQIIDILQRSVIGCRCNYSLLATLRKLSSSHSHAHTRAHRQPSVCHSQLLRRECRYHCACCCSCCCCCCCWPGCGPVIVVVGVFLITFLAACGSENIVLIQRRAINIHMSYCLYNKFRYVLILNANAKRT